MIEQLDAWGYASASYSYAAAAGFHTVHVELSEMDEWIVCYAYGPVS